MLLVSSHILLENFTLENGDHKQLIRPDRNPFRTGNALIYILILIKRNIRMVKWNLTRWLILDL